MSETAAPAERPAELEPEVFVLDYDPEKDTWLLAINHPHTQPPVATLTIAKHQKHVADRLDDNGHVRPPTWDDLVNTRDFDATDFCFNPSLTEPLWRIFNPAALAATLTVASAADSPTSAPAIPSPETTPATEPQLGADPF